MKRFTILALVVMTLGLFSQTVAAQTAVNTTTIAAAMSATANQVALTSASTVAVADVLYVDKEALRVTSITGVYATVSRGAEGTSATAHNALATIYTGPRVRFMQPRPRRGTCVRAAEAYLPRIVPSAGEIWDCPLGAVAWIQTSGNAPAVVVSCLSQLSTDMVDKTCFIADRPYYVAKITYVSTVVESAGTLTVIPRRQQGTEAAASGDAMATALSGVSTVAQTVTPFVLSTTTAFLILDTGNRLGLDFTDDVAGELAGLTVTFVLIPQ